MFHDPQDGQKRSRRTRLCHLAPTHLQRFHTSQSSSETSILPTIPQPQRSTPPTALAEGISQPACATTLGISSSPTPTRRSRAIKPVCRRTRATLSGFSLSSTASTRLQMQQVNVRGPALRWCSFSLQPICRHAAARLARSLSSPHPAYAVYDRRRMTGSFGARSAPPCGSHVSATPPLRSCFLLGTLP